MSKKKKADKSEPKKGQEPKDKKLEDRKAEKKEPKEGNLYDKIFKENAARAFLPIAEAYFGIKIETYVALDPKAQSTREVEMDFFYKIEAKGQPTFILQLEFQNTNTPEMVYRMEEYRVMARKKWGATPLRQLVLFMDSKPATMRIELPEDEVYTGYELLNICTLDAEKMLVSQVPEYILLAILAKRPKKEQAEDFIRRITRQLQRVSKNKYLRSKYLRQLLVLSGIPKLRSETRKIIKEDMPITIDFDIREDVLYKEGRVEGRVEERLVMICDGIELGLEISVLAKFLKFSEKEILKIIDGIKRNDVPLLAKLISLPEETVSEVLDEWKTKQDEK